MKKLSLAYFGTPSFSARFLEKLLIDDDLKKIIEVKLVVTQPDKPVGRKQTMTQSPVKIAARKVENLNIENSLKIENFKLKIKGVDLCLLYAYGDLIPKELLSLPKYGFWNIHPSLLPKYRGPSPIAYPLMSGEAKTGVTIIQMDEKIDHGPIIAQEEFPISPDDRRPDLEIKLTNLAFKMIKKIVLRLSEDTCFEATWEVRSEASTPTGAEKHGIERRIQDDSSATYTSLLTKSDGFIPLKNLKFQIKNSSEKLYNLFRGLYPWPGIWTLISERDGIWKKRLKITDMKLGKIKRVQLEGKKEVDFETFNKAYSVF